MTLDKMVPSSNLHRFVKLSLFAILSSACIVTASLESRAQSSSQRPVARLITSSREVAPQIYNTRVTSRPVAVNAALKSAPLAGSQSLERRAFDLINAQRAAMGQQPLVWDAELSRIARQHSNSMASNNYFDHAGPDGDLPSRIRSNNIRGWTTAAENIAYNQGFDDPASFAVQRWMQSVKHRANILNPQFSRTGIGVSRTADGRVFFTQVFLAR